LTLIEVLVVFAITATLALMASAVVVQIPERSERLRAQTALTRAVTAAWTAQLESGRFPTSAPAPLVQSDCGPGCVEFRYTPETVHRCQYWSLTTAGERGSGAPGCWP